MAGVEGGLITVDISLHEIVPKHEILTKIEQKELLERLGITSKELPKITLSDPGIQNMYAKLGDVVKIIRRSPTSGTAIAYRVIISK